MMAAVPAGTGEPVSDEEITPIPIVRVTAATSPILTSPANEVSAGSALRISASGGSNVVNVVMPCVTPKIAGPYISGFGNGFHSLRYCFSGSLNVIDSQQSEDKQDDTA